MARESVIWKAGNKNNHLREKVRHILRLDRAVRFVLQAGPGWTVATVVLLVIQ